MCCTGLSKDRVNVTAHKIGKIKFPKGAATASLHLPDHCISQNHRGDCSRWWWSTVVTHAPFLGQDAAASLVGPASQTGRDWGAWHCPLSFKTGTWVRPLLSATVHLPCPLPSWASEDNTVHQEERPILQFMAAPYHTLPEVHLYSPSLLLHLLQSRLQGVNWRDRVALMWGEAVVQWQWPFIASGENKLWFSELVESTLIHAHSWTWMGIHIFAPQLQATFSLGRGFEDKGLLMVLPTHWILRCNSWWKSAPN